MADTEINKVVQKNVSGQKIAGRDIYETNNYYNSPQIFHEDKILKKLLDEHEREKQESIEYRKFSDELNKFFKQAVESGQRDLEQKLTDGGRHGFVDIAIEAKQIATKKIQKYSYFQSAQDIYTYLLTNMRTAFTHEVQSKIKSGKFDQHTIDEIVKNKIIEPYLHNLNGSSLNIDITELYGLLYFLTGNCYLEWD